MASVKPHKSPMNRYLAIWVMACATFCLIPHFTRMPVVLVALLVLVILWRIHKHFKNPRWYLRTIAVLIAVAGIFFLHGGFWGRLPGSQLLCAMLVLKSLELNYRRDGLLMVSLSFFVVATWFLFDQSPLTFLYLIGATWLGLTTMIVLNQREDNEPGLRQVFPSSARLVFPALPLALAMFFLFPRLSIPLWGIQGGELEGTTGLSSTMRPGSISELFLDDGPAFRARFDGALPEPADSYWRGPVLWNFDGEVWSPALHTYRPPRHRPRRRNADFSYEIELEPHRQHSLFALDYPTVIPEGARLTSDYQLRIAKPVQLVKRYQMHSDIDFVDNVPLTAGVYNLALQLPTTVGAQAKELASEWRSQADTISNDPGTNAQYIVDTALEYFRDNPFFYRLDNLPILEDSIDEFLFDSKRGYCEHYASAFTFLMRAAGIPARVVTGYQGGIPNGDYFLVRQSDAHAWSEVWIEEQGWTRVDPTTAVSPTRIIQGSRAVIDAPTWLHAAWLVSVRNRLDRVRHWWNQNIVSFDAKQQIRLLEPIGIERLTQKQLIIGLSIISIIFGAFIFAWYQRAHEHPEDRLSQIWLKFRKHLQKMGVDSSAHLTSQEINQEAKQQLPWHAARLDALIQEYNTLRYSPLAEQQNSTFNTRLTAFANAIDQLKLHKKPPR